MQDSNVNATAAVLALAAALTAVPAHADGGASPEQVRALQANLVKSPPKPGDYAAQPYPGAILDTECSAEASAPRQPDTMVYCYYTRDPLEKVQAYVGGPGRPRHGVKATVEKSRVAVRGQVTIPEVTRITYWVHHKTRAFHESFPSAPPPDTELIAARYPGATYDVECSADKSMEALGKPKWRRVYCFTANDPYDKVRQAFDLEVRSTPNRGVQVDLTEVSRDPALTRIEYWLAAAPPQAAAGGPSASGRPAAPASTPMPATTSAPPQPTPTPAAAPVPATAPSPATQAVDTVNKMRGLFGR